ncbi:MAG TPA: TetR/AcrR family transcriptional regulator [Chitinophaga sp.]
MSKGDDTRQRIIEKAAALYNIKGISGTSVSDVMDATQLAKGGIYRRFENKEELTLAVFQYLATRLSNAINNAINGETTAAGRLNALLDFYTDRLALSQTGGCPLMNFGVEADDTDTSLSEQVGKGIREIQQQISSIVQEGIKTGEFKSSVNPDLFGIKTFNLLEGTILACRVMKSKAQMKSVTRLLKEEIASFKN